MGTSIQDYDVGQILGKGGFACVYRAVNKKAGNRIVAMKMIEKRHMRKFGMIKKVKDEARIHFQLKHPNILELYDCFEDDQYVYLELELCRHGELGKYLHRHGKPPISEPEACSVLRQVLDGLLYLHKYGIVHRDLTLSNLLLDDKNQIKIADFGLATKLSIPGETHMTMCGTPNYIAPEVATKSPYGPPVDVWGLGVLLYTLLIGRPPFEAAAVRATLNKVVKEEVCIPDNITYEAEDLLRRLLEKDQCKRIAAIDVPRHSFMHKYTETPLQCGREEDSGVNLTCSLCPCSRLEVTKCRNGSSYTRDLSLRSQRDSRSSCCHNEPHGSIVSRDCASISRPIGQKSCSVISGISINSSRAKTSSYNHGTKHLEPVHGSKSATPISSGHTVFETSCNPSVERNFQEPVHSDPLKPQRISTVRLRETTHAVEKVSYYILRSGDAVMEYIPRNSRRKHRFQVSGDGNEILIEGIEGPMRKKQQRYNYEELPRGQWQKYAKLREFIQMVQRYTVKISLGTKMAACSLMESSDHFSAYFLTGYTFRKLGNDVIVVNSSGSEETYPFDSLLQKCRNAPSDHTHHFLECYEKCLEIERNLEVMGCASFMSLFPATFGTYNSATMDEQVTSQSLELPKKSKMRSRAESTPVKKPTELSGRKSQSCRQVEKAFEDGVTLTLNTDSGDLKVEDTNGAITWFSVNDPHIPTTLVAKLRELRGQISSSGSIG